MTAPPPSGPTRYSRVAMLLHWAIAALILLNIVLGLLWDSFQPPLKFVIFFVHISAGMTVLALTLVRIGWRLTHRPPPFLPGMAPWERLAAHVVHGLLYGAMVAMPLIGWAAISAHPPDDAAWRNAPPKPALKVWGVIPLPTIAPLEQIGSTRAGGDRQKRLHDQFAQAHALGGYILIGLLILHIGGALKHQLIDRVPQFARMLPARAGHRSVVDRGRRAGVAEEIRVFNYVEMPRETLFNGQLTRSALRSDGSIVTFNWFRPGYVGRAPHHHPFDQLSLVVEGTLAFMVDGVEHIMGPGTALRVPADVPHTVSVLGADPVLNIDIFAPARADYLFLAEHQLAATATTP